MYTSSVRNVAIVLLMLVFSQNELFSQNKEGAQPVQPMLFEATPASQTEPEQTNSVNKELILFHSKELIEKEKQFHALRRFLSPVNGDGIIDDAIRSMYVPFKKDPISECDFTFTEGFDKSIIPNDLSKCNAYLLEYFNQDELNDLNFCLNYLGIQAVDQEIYLYYVLPHKNNIRFFKQIQLSGRDLAWFVAIDLRQTICLKQETLLIKEELLNPIQVRPN
jgi:hypothetical protein